MPQFLEFRSILKLGAAEREDARTAHRVLREAEIRQSDREGRLITFRSCADSDPSDDTDPSPPPAGEA